MQGKSNKGFKIIWILYIASFVFHFAIPGVGLTNTTVLLLPLVGYAMLQPSEFFNKKLIAILLFVMFGIMSSGFFGEHLSAIYVNLVIWIVNAIIFSILFVNPKLRKLAIKVWAISVLLFLVYRFLTIAGMPKLSLFINQKNGVGLILSIFFPVFIIYFKQVSKPSIFKILFAFYWTIILLNASRSAMISCAITSIFYYYIVNIKINRNYSSVLLLPFLFFGFILLIPLLKTLSPTLNNQFNDIELFVSSDYNVENIEASSFSLRYLILEKGIELFERNPYHGVGLNRFQQYHGTKLDFITFYKRGKKEFYNAHNSYIALLAETGLMGIIPFIILLIFIFSYIHKTIRLIIKLNYTSDLFLSVGMSIAAIIELAFIHAIVSIIIWPILILPMVVYYAYSKGLFLTNSRYV